MRQKNDKNRPRGIAGQAVAWALLVFIAMTGVLLPASRAQYERNTADLESSTRVQAVETAVRLQQEIDHHLKLLVLLHDKLATGAEVTAARFAAEAGMLTDAWPAFQAINWATPQGVIHRVVPQASNHEALGLDVTEVPLAADAFRRALAGADITATPPLMLRQGGRGVVVYLAVRKDGAVRGVINGVFRLDSLFGTLLSDGLLERYSIEVVDDAATVYAAGTVTGSFATGSHPSVIFDQRRWEVRLSPRAERVADFAAQFRDEALGIFALALLAALLAGLLIYKQMSLRHTELRFRELNRLLPDMVFECDEHWRITYLNRLAHEQLGYSARTLEAGLGLADLVAPDEVNHYFATLREELTADQPVTRICAIRCHDGSTTACEATFGAIRDAGGRFRGLRAVLRDISERLDAERAMNRLANFDSTTQLPNRAMFLQVLGQEIRQSAAQGRRLVLMVIDLDNFKSINDRLGPSMGDLLLREAGQRLRDVLDRKECVFRVSGDEFAVLFDGLGTHEEIEHMAQLLLDTLRQPYHLQTNAEEVVDATLGISVFPDDASNCEQMYMHADAAVYEAKSAGGRRYCRFTQAISRQLNERKQVEEALRHAVRRDEFRLVYQPVINSETGGIISLEALIRWQHPVRGLLTPYHFIRLAEETGQIDEIGAWVLQEACRQLVEWDRAGVYIPQVSVNVSAHQLESDAISTDVRRALRDQDLDGDRLVLELTESLLMRDVHFAARTLTALKRHGVRTAVDDFGTGYSSLAYLHRLPIDALKIDRAFIAPIGAPGGDTRVTEAVIALGRSLKLHIVAEGVETAKQADFLAEQGCTSMQGFLFSKPVPAAGVPALLARDWKLAEIGARKLSTSVQ